MAQPIRILHLHSTFDLGGKEARAVRLMNAFGDRARHVIVSSMEGRYGARERIAKGIRYEIAQDPPPLAGKPSVKRYEAIARYMRGFDLVLTYNWGAIDGAMARRVFGAFGKGGGVPPLVHHEDGFNEDEAGGLKRERNLYRRLALGAAHGLAVPSETLERIALETWKQPRAKVHRIVNGIATALYARDPEPKAIPGFVRKPKEVVIGTVAGLRAVKDLPLLVRAAGGLAGKYRLVIVGEGPERAEIERAAMAMGIDDKVLLPGFLDRPYRYMRHFDLLALSSRSEQFPISVVEAMAAGLPIVAPPVGDVPRMVSAENLPFVAEYATEVKLRDAMQPLLNDAALRAQVGAANQAKARAEYDEGVMIARYAALYEEAMGRPGVLRG
ncbi:MULTISPECIES: glycosyltransferase family 4 protein [unclassified Sphingomonas]|uniref:glycosyltransferase family 4 protein n=1 Tax=unclassified Sphingomonas TaxID=196159 RepID=UPI000929066D|nr:MULTISPECIES: glycosyltransferase family 4 protein [unclassified Sphingomonas]MBN8846510.1 glycosyltransferase family 4 protein [Sphingomonas sp.]OJV29326.1 MAG: glycosyl transferase family 1 [Sphingomonas sp. 67-36]